MILWEALAAHVDGCEEIFKLKPFSEVVACVDSVLGDIVQHTTQFDPKDFIERQKERRCALLDAPPDVFETQCTKVAT